MGRCIVIYNMYQNIKSRIVYNNTVSDFFDCNNGVRQVEKSFTFTFFDLFKWFGTVFKR